jgi:RNA polymerase-binding protein DksA
MLRCNYGKEQIVAKKKNFNKQDLKKIREELIKQKAKILEELLKIRGEALKKSQKDSSGDLSGYTLHMADMATDLYDREFSLELAEGERERLYALDDAIRRIDEGTYGVCDMCGCNITKQRLKVMPQAKYCIKCQEKEEKSEGR